MMVVIDFTNGPLADAEPPQHHVHVQVTCVVEARSSSFAKVKEQRLKAGDILWVPSIKKHGIPLLTKSARLVECFNPIRQDFL